MTIEELEIIVTAKVEEAIREVMKLAPQIKQAMKQAQEALSKIDMNEFNKKLKQSMSLVKKQVDNLKSSSKNNEIAIKVNNKQAKKQIGQVEKQIESLQKKTTKR